MTPEHVSSLIAVFASAVTGYFLWLNNRKADSNHRVLIGKVDENTAVNAEQIRVGNHVNEKLLDTTQLAVDANKVAVVSIQDVMHAIAENRREQAVIKGMLLMMTSHQQPAPAPVHPEQPPTPADRHFAQVRTIRAETPSLQTPANGD